MMLLVNMKKRHTKISLHLRGPKMYFDMHTERLRNLVSEVSEVLKFCEELSCLGMKD